MGPGRGFVRDRARGGRRDHWPERCREEHVTEGSVADYVSDVWEGGRPRARRLPSGGWDWFSRRVDRPGEHLPQWVDSRHEKARDRRDGRSDYPVRRRRAFPGYARQTILERDADASGVLGGRPPA